MIKTFRAQIKDNDTHRIRLSTNNGLIGYKIKRFDIISEDVAGSATEHIMQLYSQEPDSTTTPTGSINFDNPLLLGVSFTSSLSNMYAGQTKIIFDNVIINQDVYVTHVDSNPGSSVSANYHIELEQVKLDLNEATVATLKDMRGRE